MPTTHQVAVSEPLQTPEKNLRGGAGGWLTGGGVPHEAGGGEGPRPDEVALLAVGAPGRGGVGRWRLEDDVAERGEAGVVEEEEALEVDGPDAGSEGVREAGGVVGEEVARGGDGQVFEVVVCGEGVRVDGVVGGVGEDELVERLVGRGVGLDEDAVLDQRGEGLLDGLEGGVEVRAGEAVDGVEEHVDDIAVLREVDGREGRCGEEVFVDEVAEEGVGGDVEDAVAMDVEVDMIGGDDDGVGEETVDAEGWAEGERHRSVVRDLLF